MTDPQNTTTLKILTRDELGAALYQVAAHAKDERGTAQALAIVHSHDALQSAHDRLEKENAALRKRTAKHCASCLGNDKSCWGIYVPIDADAKLGATVREMREDIENINCNNHWVDGNECKCINCLPRKQLLAAIDASSLEARKDTK